MQNEKILCLDVETTGLDFENDEIVQLSIINGNGDVLFNEYIKPEHQTEWDAAEAIHGISPQMVRDKKTIREYLSELNALFADADMLVGYNSDYFDLPMLRHAGVNIPEDIPTFDVMHAFSPIYGDWSKRYKTYKWQKLSTCASFYDYVPEGGYHDSLEDVRATLHCYLAMTSPEATLADKITDYLESYAPAFDYFRGFVSDAARHKILKDGVDDYIATVQRLCTEYAGDKDTIRKDTEELIRELNDYKNIHEHQPEEPRQTRTHKPRIH